MNLRVSPISIDMQRLYTFFLLLILMVYAIKPLSGQVSEAYKQNLDEYHEVAIDVTSLTKEVAEAPVRGLNQKSSNSTVVISLPMPDGSQQQFSIVEAAILSPALSALRPGFKSYAGQGIDDPTAVVRFNITPMGLYGVIRGIQGISIIESTDKSNPGDQYITYFDHDITSESESKTCHSVNEMVSGDARTPYKSMANSCFQNGANLRTYGMVATCTGEFYQLNGNSDAGAIAAILARITQINTVYEVELSISFTIVEFLLNANPATDVFTNPTNTSTSINQAINYINDNVTVADWDIGHGFHEITCGGGCSFGGLAGVGVACTSQKASGYTLLPNDIPNSVSVLLHEIGHMFGSWHSNYGCDSGGNCVRYEPGQGSTIMSTPAGCDAGDSFTGISDYFGVGNLQAILDFASAGTVINDDAACTAFTQFGWSDCATITPTGNNMPIADANANSIDGLTIPHSTPFTLSGTGTDQDGTASLTYNWEQYDTDYAGSDAPDDTGSSTTAPQFRSFPPSMSNERTCPQLSSILAGNITTGTGEVLPTIARTLNWRLVVRDNEAGGGGVACDQVTLSVGSDGPFQLTSQNANPVWLVNTTETITWDVANTDAAAYTCGTVDILYSDDGGATFSTTLAAGVTNDGSQDITVPSTITSMGRLKIVCAGGSNIFFDINNADIVIVAGCAAAGGTITNDDSVTAIEGDAALDLSLFAGVGMTNVTGTLDAADSNSNLAVDDDGAGTCVALGNNPKYETLAFSVAADATVNFSRTSQGDYTSMITLYEDSYDANNECTNWLNSNGNFNGSLVNVSTNFDEVLTTGTQYVLVSSAFSSATPPTGAYEVIFDHTLYNTNSITPLGHAYTYVIVNTTTGDIVAFDLSADLSNRDSFPLGSYEVYGLSYLLVENLSTYIGVSLTTLQTDIANSGFCGALSSNSVMVTIEPDDCPNITTISASTASACVDETFNITAAGLATMDGASNADQDFGIDFVAFANTPTDPYVGGTSLGVVSFGSLTDGGSIATLTGATFASAGTYEIYTILTPAPTDVTCRPSRMTTITVEALDDATFTYGANTYCADDTDPTLTITGLPGGVITSSPSGLSISPTTLAIDVSASTPGAYTVTYTTAGACPNSSDVSITINALDDATFNYNAAAYCADATDPAPMIAGLAGGTFTSTPSGLLINPSTGLIDVSGSTPDTYMITYTTAGDCPNSSVVSVIINAVDNASFNYNASSYCMDGIDPTPMISGASGGTFSSAPSGLSISASTGAIDVSASTPNTYTVTYTTGGTCPNSAVTNIIIKAIDNASFNYGAATYCTDAVDPTPTIGGLVGGTFSSTPAGLLISAATGSIDVSGSTPNTYVVTYTTAGDCPNSATANITINALDNAGFSYNATEYCSVGTDPMPTITGLAGGMFSSAPVGLSINTSTGVIDVSESTLNNYTVTYVTAGNCPNSTTANVTINALDNADFNYNAGAYCLDATDPIPTIVGLAGGVFSSTPAGLLLNNSTGEIDVSGSTPDTYTVTYTTTGACSNNTDATVIINALDDAGFSYNTAAYCVDATDPTPTITGLSGGTFTSIPAGLSLSGSTGVIDVSSSAPGIYIVNYATAGTCPNSFAVSVTINALDNADFNYSTSAYCVDATDPTPTITGLTRGVFSSTAGLSINPSTGAIDVSASTPATYTVTYTTGGTCTNSADVNVTINALDDAGFNYNAAAYCIDATDPTPMITGLTGGTFSSTAGLVINASTGAIDVSASTPNTYTVTYTTSGTCTNSTMRTVTINALDNAGFSYSESAYCVDATDPTPMITGLTGGTFSSTAGLIINASSGVIDLSASLPNTYSITYTTAGDCSNTATTNITLNNNATCMIYYACTQDSIDATAVLMAAHLLPQEIRAKLFITSDGVIPAGDQYDFYAGKAIELTPGFTVEQDGVFHAIIESCIAALNAADPWRE